MGKLNQTLAVVTGLKTQANKSLTQAYHVLQKNELFNGLVRTYTPRDEEGERLPSESKRIQTKVSEVIQSVRDALKPMYDAVATQDRANRQASADVVVDGETLLEAVPVTHLLFLEKQMTDLETFVTSFPTLDPTSEWHLDESRGCYATTPTESVRTKKVPKAFVKYEATEQHPAQVETFTEDIQVGTWTLTNYSAALSEAEKQSMLKRVRKLREAVSKAREEANSLEVTEVREADTIFNYVFNGEKSTA